MGVMDGGVTDGGVTDGGVLDGAASPRRGGGRRSAIVVAVAVLAVLALVLAGWLAVGNGQPYTGIAPTATLRAGPAPDRAAKPRQEVAPASEVARASGAAKSVGWLSPTPKGWAKRPSPDGGCQAVGAGSLAAGFFLR